MTPFLAAPQPRRPLPLDLSTIPSALPALLPPIKLMDSVFCVRYIFSLPTRFHLLTPPIHVQCTPTTQRTEARLLSPFRLPDAHATRKSSVPVRHSDFRFALPI